MFVNLAAAASSSSETFLNRNLLAGIRSQLQGLRRGLMVGRGLLHAPSRTLLEPRSALSSRYLRNLEGFVYCAHPDLQGFCDILDPCTLSPE